MVEAGYTVVFDQEGNWKNSENRSYALHKATGLRIPIHRRDRIFEMTWNILDYETASALPNAFPQDFLRPVSTP